MILLKIFIYKKNPIKSTLNKNTVKSILRICTKNKFNKNLKLCKKKLRKINLWRR